MLIHLSIIIVTVLAMYYRTFSYGYIIDDIDLVKPKEQEEKDFLKRVWGHIMGIKYTDSRLAHIITTLAHLINCLVIYFLFGHNNISFVTALLFGLNPVTNQAAIWLSGKPYAMVATLLMLGLLITPLMPFIYSFCLVWAPNALLFPLMFIMHQPHWYLLLLPIIGWYASKRFRGIMKGRIKGGTDEMTKLAPRKIIIVMKSLGYYFRHCLFPIRIGMCHSYLHTFGLSPEETKGWYKLDKYFWLGIAVSILGIIALFNYKLPLSYGFLWFLFLTIQWCNLVMVNHPITERYIYLPTIGLMYSLAQLIIGTPFMWMFLTFYAVRLFYFLPAYKDLISYWSSNIENFPDVAMGYNQLGLAWLNFGNTGSAIDVWIHGIQLRKHDFRLSYNLASIMIATGNIPQAANFLKTAEANLDKKNNYDFWFDSIQKMKEDIQNRGFNLDGTMKGKLIPPEKVVEEPVLVGV